MRWDILLIALNNTVTFAEQTSVDNGIAYLRATQNADGSWGGTATSCFGNIAVAFDKQKIRVTLCSSDSSLSHSPWRDLNVQTVTG